MKNMLLTNFARRMTCECLTLINMKTKNNIKTVVTKAILGCNGKFPIALVKVPANVRTVRVAGASTSQGNLVNVWIHSVTANKRSLKLAESMDLPDAEYNEKMDAFMLVEHKF